MVALPQAYIDLTLSLYLNLALTLLEPCLNLSLTLTLSLPYLDIALTLP